MTTIPLPWSKPPLSANSVRDNHHVRGKAVRAVVATTRMTLRLAKVQPFAPPVEIALHYQAPDRRRRDADGLHATLKPTLDALVREGLLPDDSWAYVPRVSCVIHRPGGRGGRMWLEVLPAREEATP